MGLSIHIDFNDQCQEAFEFYAQSLDGKIGFMLRFKDSPASQMVSDERQEKIVHANITIDGVELAGADVPGAEYVAPSGFYILLEAGSEARVKSIYKRLASGGTSIMAPQQTFWSPCYATVVDRFGVPWKINGRS